MSEFATVGGALAHLDQLLTSDAIATELHRRGIRSKPGCPEACALADYITDTVTVFDVHVTGDFVCGYYSADESGNPENEFEVSTSKQVQQFVTEFDAGFYPSLISPSFRGVLGDAP